MVTSRLELDHIARAVVSGRRGLSRSANRLADLAAGLMRNRLEAAGAPGARAARPRAVPNAASLHFERLVPGALVDRVAKHLAWRALAEERGERSFPG